MDTNINNIQPLQLQPIAIPFQPNPNPESRLIKTFMELETTRNLLKNAINKFHDSKKKVSEAEQAINKLQQSIAEEKIPKSLKVNTAINLPKDPSMDSFVTQFQNKFRSFELEIIKDILEARKAYLITIRKQHELLLETKTNEFRTEVDSFAKDYIKGTTTSVFPIDKSILVSFLTKELNEYIQMQKLKETSIQRAKQQKEEEEKFQDLQAKESVLSNTQQTIIDLTKITTNKEMDNRLKEINQLKNNLEQDHKKMKSLIESFSKQHDRTTRKRTHQSQSSKTSSSQTHTNPHTNTPRSNPSKKQRVVVPKQEQTDGLLKNGHGGENYQTRKEDLHVTFHRQPHRSNRQ